MKGLHIITPVKDSITRSIETMRSVVNAMQDLPATYTVYNDFSTPDNTALLHQEGARLGVEVIDLADLTQHPSPNYLLVLQRSQELALKSEAGLLIVESDVSVKTETLKTLFEHAKSLKNCGMAAAITVDETEKINYPYLFAQKLQGDIIDCKKHLSFCCSLLTPALLRAVNFKHLDASKNWFDVHISHASLEAGLHNYLFRTLTVTHHPHGSRPWKQLKYENPLKYYWTKWTKGFDKI